MRERRAGLLDRLIERATKGGLQAELAVLLGVSRFSVYKWNLGQPPSYEHCARINALCKKHGVRVLYRGVPPAKKNGHGRP